MEKSSRRSFLSTSAAAAGAAAVGSIGFTRLSAAQDLGSIITQTASFRLNAEKEAEAVALLQELTAAVEANEPGVLAYIAHRSADDPTVIVFFEVYEDEEALAGHGQQPHLAKLREGFGGGIFAPLSADSPVKIERLDRVSGFCR